jgi:hypothetical protein
MFGPLVRDVCSNVSGVLSDAQVRTAGVLALCKLMCVSAEYCEENLQVYACGVWVWVRESQRERERARARTSRYANPETSGIYQYRSTNTDAFTGTKVQILTLWAELQLLFSIMIGAPEAAVRSNVVVALGDMAFRYSAYSRY